MSTYTEHQNFITYSTNNCCPICGSNNFTIGEERTEIAQSIPMKAEEIYQQSLIKFTPALCEHCGMSFNVKGLSDEARNNVCLNYQFIRPSQSVGAKNYLTYINEVKKHLTGKDTKVLEIGGYDGFLLRELSKDGYQDLTLIDPSAKVDDIDEQVLPNIKTTVGFFPSDDMVYKQRLENTSSECQLYDVVGAKDVVQMIPDLLSFFEGLNAVLKVGGIAVCCSVPINAMHALQQSHMGFNAYHYLATQYGFELLEKYKKPENSYIVYVLKKAIDLKSSTEQEIAAFRQEHSLSKESFEHYQNIARQQLNDKSAISTKASQKLSKIFKSAKDIVIYGTGFYTFNLLDCLDKSYFSLANQADKAKLTLVNSTEANEGYLYMLPDSSTITVHYANKHLANRNIEVLVLGVQNPNFKDEILANLQAINCNCQQIIYLPDLEQD